MTFSFQIHHLLCRVFLYTAKLQSSILCLGYSLCELQRLPLFVKFKRIEVCSLSEDGISFNCQSDVSGGVNFGCSGIALSMRIVKFSFMAKVAASRPARVGYACNPWNQELWKGNVMNSRVKLIRKNLNAVKVSAFITF